MSTLWYLCVCVVKNVARRAGQRCGCVRLPPDILPLSLIGLTAVGECSCHLKAHRAKCFCLIAFVDPLLWPERFFLPADVCQLLLEWTVCEWEQAEDKGYEFFWSSSALTNATIWKCLKGYECLNWDCAESYNAMENLNQCKKVWISVNISQFEWCFYENVWRSEKSLKMSGCKGISYWLPL